jgi:hypothetical protein
LSGVNLIDRDAVKFLATFETARAKLANCPRYIREWIRRDGASNKGPLSVNFADQGVSAAHDSKQALLLFRAFKRYGDVGLNG